MKELVLFDASKINAVAIFADKDSIDPILRQIEAEVISHVPDVSTNKGRDYIASLAHKVAKSKVALDDAGKNLVAGWKEQAKVVDESRKHARDYLDDLKERVRKPLTDWENAEAARIEAERLEKERIEAERLAAIAEEARLKQEALEKELADLRAKEFAREEAIRIEREAQEEKERLAKLEADRIANEERIRKEAELKAQKEAEEKLQREREAAALRELTLRQEAEAAEKARLKAIEDARIAQENAVKAERERIEKEQREQAAKVEAERIAAEKKAANENHRKKINNAILDKMVAIGISKEHGTALIISIAKSEIDNLRINY